MKANSNPHHKSAAEVAAVRLAVRVDQTIGASRPLSPATQRERRREVNADIRLLALAEVALHECARELLRDEVALGCDVAEACGQIRAWKAFLRRPVREGGQAPAPSDDPFWLEAGKAADSAVQLFRATLPAPPATSTAGPAVPHSLGHPTNPPAAGNAKGGAK